jgi:hypothetical protein
VTRRPGPLFGRSRCAAPVAEEPEHEHAETGWSLRLLSRLGLSFVTSGHVIVATRIATPVVRSSHRHTLTAGSFVSPA